MIASSKWVPASFTERIVETPPKDTTAMSVVPPPISTTIFPKGFEISIPAYEYDNTLPDEYRNEQIILQGIIDLYFEDKNGDIILVDYKTDKCTSEAEQLAVAKKYEKQLILYARAMEKILKKSVKDKYLYLFSPQSVVKLD